MTFVVVKQSCRFSSSSLFSFSDSSVGKQRRMTGIKGSQHQSKREGLLTRKSSTRVMFDQIGREREGREVGKKHDDAFHGRLNEGKDDDDEG